MRVRAVVVNYNGAGYVERAVERLLAAGGAEVVVVDNASTDGSAEALEHRFGREIRLVRSERNLGFAGGNNLALTDLDGLDAVALVNSDAFVPPGWLGPLTAALAADRSVGAACPKIVFEPTFTEVRLVSPTFVPARRDPASADRRTLGLRVTGAGTAHEDRWASCLFPAGWSWPEPGGRWTTGNAVLWVPVEPGDDEVVVTVEGEATARRFPVGERFDVINNVGNELDERWYGRDRGFMERDRGQYDRPADVWGWCGAAVLLRADYLRTVGLFDERYFLYYEDTDLAWRGRRAGWRSRLVPEVVVRHRHAASSDASSELFDHLNQRNRLVLLAHHAPRRVLAVVVARYLGEIARNAWGEIARPVLAGHRPHPNLTTRRVRAGAAAVRLLSREVLGRS